MRIGLESVLRALIAGLPGVASHVSHLASPPFAVDFRHAEEGLP